ncbi:MAG: hypothetical protein ACLRVX_02160 [Faecalibacterium sp.]
MKQAVSKKATHQAVWHTTFAKGLDFKKIHGILKLESSKHGAAL